MERQAAIEALMRCCGSRRWARSMADVRPFASADHMVSKADAIWVSLGADDWREAFAAHPRIGADGPQLSGWSADEQSGVTAGSRARFAELNRRYEERFGHLFIVCATGRSAGEMLQNLERRLRHEPGEELLEAAEEQRRIIRLRLTKLTT